MNIAQRILQYLESLEDWTTKSSIARDLNTSESYIARGLADLGRNNLVRQSKGKYIITFKGKSALKDDPELISFYVRQRSSKVAFSLPIREIEESELCREIVLTSQERILNFASLEASLLPYVLLWCKINNVTLPDFHWKVDPDGDEIQKDILERTLLALALAKRDPDNDFLNRYRSLDIEEAEEIANRGKEER